MDKGEGAGWLPKVDKNIVNIIKINFAIVDKDWEEGGGG